MNLMGWIEKISAILKAFTERSFTGVLTLEISFRKGGIRSLKQKIETILTDS